MIKLTIGIVLVALFAYAFKLVLGLRHIARKEKELALAAFEEEVVDIDNEIQVKKKRTAKKKKVVEELNGEDTEPADTTEVAAETADTQN